MELELEVKVFRCCSNWSAINPQYSYSNTRYQILVPGIRILVLVPVPVFEYLYLIQVLNTCVLTFIVEVATTHESLPNSNY